MRYRNLIWLGIGAMVGGLAIGMLVRDAARQQTESPVATTLEPAAAADIPLPDLAGQPRRLADWRGQVLIVNFWATWCPPCIHEIPEFIALQRELGDRGVQFVGIAMDDPQAVADFVREQGVNYPTLLDNGEGIALARALGNAQGVLPYTLVLDRQGAIQRRHAGAITRDELAPTIMDLLD
jgi:thiol-disulfide isomerase/thioredoxin